MMAITSGNVVVRQASTRVGSLVRKLLRGTIDAPHSMLMETWRRHIASAVQSHLSRLRWGFGCGLTVRPIAASLPPATTSAAAQALTGFVSWLVGFALHHPCSCPRILKDRHTRSLALSSSTGRSSCRIGRPPTRAYLRGLFPVPRRRKARRHAYILSGDRCRVCHSHAGCLERPRRVASQWRCSLVIGPQGRVACIRPVTQPANSLLPVSPAALPSISTADACFDCSLALLHRMDLRCRGVCVGLDMQSIGALLCMCAERGQLSFVARIWGRGRVWGLVLPLFFSVGLAERFCVGSPPAAHEFGISESVQPWGVVACVYGRVCACVREWMCRRVGARCSVWVMFCWY